MGSKPLAVRTIIVAGGGMVGWSTAAALRRRIPALAVTVLPVPSPADALADRIGTTLPSILDFHNDIGISEGDIVSRIGCNFRLGTAFEGWTDGDDYVHAYDDYGRPLGTTSFHLHWVRAKQAGRVAPFDSHSPAAAMGRAGRFVHPQGEPGSPLAGFGYGLRIDPERYRQMLRAYALHVGVAEGPGTMRSSFGPASRYLADDQVCSKNTRARRGATVRLTALAVTRMGRLNMDARSLIQSLRPKFRVRSPDRLMPVKRSA